MFYPKRLITITMMITAIVTAMGSSICTANLKVGDMAPNFSLIDENGNVVTLSAYRGQDIALVIYPTESSPFCRLQIGNMHKDWALLQEQGITVLAVSADSSAKHKAFKEQYNLPFKFLMANNAMLKKYNAKGWFTPIRKTYLINKNGVIVHIIDDVKLRTHAQQIIAGFNK